MPWPSPFQAEPPPTQCAPFKSFADVKRRLAVGAVITVDWVRDDGLVGRRDADYTITGRHAGGAAVLFYDGAGGAGGDGSARGLRLPALAGDIELATGGASATWQLERRRDLYPVTAQMTRADRNELVTAAAASAVRVTLVQEPKDLWAPQRRERPRARKTMTDEAADDVSRGLRVHAAYWGSWRYYRRETGDDAEPFVGWTTGVDPRGRYLSWMAVPVSAKGGDGSVWVDPDSISGHRLRKDAIARAERLKATWIRDSG